MTIDFDRYPAGYAFIHEPTHDAHVVHVYGEVDLALASEFEAAVATAAESGMGISINLAACSYIDSSILAMLILQAKKHQGRLGIVLPTSGAVQRLFQMTSLADVLPVQTAAPELSRLAPPLDMLR